MNKILLLSEDVINKISAGEVVERPKNVIKELVENSIDANSDSITITIKNGGKDYISVLDNGSGIQKDDIQNAFLPHATSKIKTDEDLYSVLSLGFRGEALASICAVSKVSLTTKTEEDELGTKITVLGGNILEEKEVPFNRGTFIEVSEIFQNVPARLKFLKKTVTESSVITEFVQKIAICYPNISFKYINNGTVILETSGNGDLKEVLYRIYGKDVVTDTLEINFKNDKISISGLICKGSTYRANRNYENFYLNKRIIKSNILRKAVEDGYKGRLPIGKFPVFALSFSIDPKDVDINVHPSKEEVRFTDDEYIYDILFDIIEKRLIEDINIPKAFREDKAITKVNIEVKGVDTSPREIKNNIIEKISEEIKLSSFMEEYPSPKLSFSDVKKNESTIINIQEIDLDKIEAEEKNRESQKNTTEEIVSKNISEVTEVIKPKKPSLYENEFFNNVKVIGQLFDTYWLIEADGTGYIIDQHSAHEKILYEEYMHSYKNRDISTQMLLMPISLILSDEESYILEQNIELFSDLGFEIEIFGKNTFAIRSIPFVFDTVSSPSFFLDILENIKSLGKNKANLSEIYEEKIITMSCKSAVKANDKLSFNDARIIIEKLTKLENPFNCPHGRPTIVELSKTQIEKMFKRVL